MKNKLSPKSEVRSPKLIWVFIMLLTLDCLYSENKVITDVKKWEYIETEHFKIYHYSECCELLPVVSEILEDTFNNTTRFYEYRPSKKIPFFIYRNHNEFEQTNIVDVGEGTGGVTEAFKNRFIVYNNGEVRWLKNVIPHEFTHVIQFTVLYEESALLKALRLTRGIFIPLWMMEGMAEYNTGDTDATTREMVIRDMVSNKNVISLKNLSTFNHLKPHQITPAYKLSETAYHFLVDEYGPDKPQKILKVLRDKLDTTSAFTDTLNITPGLFAKKWKEWLFELYEDKITGLKEAKDYGLKLTEDNGDNIPDFNTNPTISPDGKSIAYITDDDGIDKLVMVSLSETKKKTRVVVAGSSMDIDVIHNEKVSFSPDGNFLAFSGEKTQKDYIFIYDIKNEKLSKLPLNIFTVKSPSFSPDGKKIIFIGMKRAYNDIYEFSFEDNSVKKITDDMENQSSPSYSPDGNFIAFSQEDSATYQSDVFLFDIKTKTKTRLTNFSGNELEPVFSNDGKQIFFTSDENPGSPINIYTVSVDGKEIKKCTNLLTGAFNPCPTPDGENLVFVNYRNFRKDIYIADISTFDCKISQVVKAEDFLIETSTGNKSLLASPIFPYRFKPSLDILVPFVMYHSEYGLFLATYWQASELLGNHQIYNQLLYSSGSGDLQYAVGYSYLKWRPQFVFSSVGENSEYLTTSEEIYKEKERTQSIAVIYPLDRFNRLEAAVSTNKYIKKNSTLDELVLDQRTNRYSVAYDRNTITGKYLYARFGSDFRVLYRCAFLEYDGNIEYKEYVLRYEKYFPVFSESAVVLGNLFVASEGLNKRYFRLPIRGFSHSDEFHKYSRLIATTLEYRFPILTLENIWPISDFFLKSINTFFFTDNGFGFNNTQDYQNITIGEIKNSVGIGVRFYTFLAGYLLPVTVEYAKRTNDFGDRWSFSLGVSLAY
ncbi:MAG: PD40 domain-containing protein [Elusimicrobia bacterium]|nr:PD40 domain-containing protein [Elusimicrobiota bacterium]